MVSRTAQCLRQLSLGVDVWWSFHTSVLTLAWRYLTCLRSSSEGSCYWSEHWTSRPTISHGTPNLQCNKPQHFQRNRGFLSVQYRCISFVDAIGSFMLVPCVSYQSGFPRAWRFLRQPSSLACAQSSLSPSRQHSFVVPYIAASIPPTDDGRSSRCVDCWGKAQRVCTSARQHDRRLAVQTHAASSKPAHQTSLRLRLRSLYMQANYGTIQNQGDATMSESSGQATRRHDCWGNAGRTVAKDHRLSREQGDSAKWSAKLEVVNVWR